MACSLFCSREECSTAHFVAVFCVSWRNIFPSQQINRTKSAEVVLIHVVQNLEWFRCLASNEQKKLYTCLKVEPIKIRPGKLKQRRIARTLSVLGFVSVLGHNASMEFAWGGLEELLVCCSFCLRIEGDSIPISSGFLLYHFSFRRELRLVVSPFISAEGDLTLRKGWSNRVTPRQQHASVTVCGGLLACDNGLPPLEAQFSP